MNAPKREKSRFLIFASIAGLLIAVIFLAGILSVAGAQDDVPFNPVLVDAVPGQSKAMAPVDTNSLGQAWRTVFAENFESQDWENKWDVNIDLSDEPKKGLKWGAQVIGNSEDPDSTKSGWGICADVTCSNVDPIAPSYPGGVAAWLVAGPFDLTAADDALVNFDLLYEADAGDPFTVSVSEDRFSFTPQLTVNENVQDGAWEPKTVSLSSFAGKPQLWIAFTFESGSSASKLGALVDNIEVWTEGEPLTYLPYISYGFTPTPPQITPTATTPPAGADYETKFDNDIDPWRRVFWSKDYSYELKHNSDCDSNRCGFLELRVEEARTFIIVSPVLVSKAPPYTVEARALIKDKQKGDKYSLVWGADWNGDQCPLDDLSTCFNKYYELRVRYNTGSGESFLEYRLIKVTGHDSENQPEGDDLIPWTKAKGINEQGWVKWYVEYKADGKIKIFAEDDSGSGKIEFEDANSTEFINNPLFGLIVKTDTGDNTGTRVKFDMFRIK